MTAIQLGIQNSVGSLTSKPTRDVLMQDFSVVETVYFPEYVLIYLLPKGASFRMVSKLFMTTVNFWQYLSGMLGPVANLERG